MGWHRHVFDCAAAMTTLLMGPLIRGLAYRRAYLPTTRRALDHVGAVLGLRPQHLGGAVRPVCFLSAHPVVALTRHAQCADECPLVGANRTLTNAVYRPLVRPHDPVRERGEQELYAVRSQQIW